MIKKIDGQAFADKQFRDKMLELIEKNYDRVVKKLNIK
ncbi:MAG: hypothetical protein ACD_47C00219G0005 [uncultured bacterium]|nr:MAG: hypothetical protein ACD_47C00219G0005 [uncultured bacterium]